MDRIDREILRLLRENARIPNAEIARRVGLAPSAIFQRIRKLEESGVIRGYTVKTDARALGYGMAAFVLIRTNDAAREVDTAARLDAIPEVQEVHRVVGEDCYFVKLRVRDTDDLARVLEEAIQPIPSIASTRTTIVVKTSKESIHVPLEQEAMVA